MARTKQNNESYYLKVKFYQKRKCISPCKRGSIQINFSNRLILQTRWDTIQGMSIFTVKIIFGFFFFLIIGHIFWICHQANVLLEQEQGKKPVYTIKCTAYLNGLRYVYTRFSIYNEFIVISRWKKYIIKYEDILTAQKRRFLFLKSLNIKHSIKKVPTISLYMKNIDTPLKIIQEHLKKNV